MQKRYPKPLLYLSAIIMLSVLSIIIGVFLYAIYLRLDYSFDIGPKFSRFDEQLGWTLKANAISHIKGSSILKGTTYFDSKVFTEENGFRSSKEQLPASQGAVLAIGDSWTFGYCVDYEETYPFFLGEELGLPVVNMGIPAYGSGSTYGLLKRHVGQLQPQVVVYFSIGLWERGSLLFDNEKAAKQFEENTLLPVILHNLQRDDTRFVYPKPGKVLDSVAEGIYPGGSLTAGYNLWNYLWHVKLSQALNALAKKSTSLFSSNQDTSSSETFSSSAHSAGVQKLLEYELNLYLNLAEKHDFEFVLLEAPHGASYASAVKTLNAHPKSKMLTYIGPEEFQKQVYDKAEEMELPEDARRVPRDGHFAYGINQLIAKLVANRISKKVK